MSIEFDTSWSYYLVVEAQKVAVFDSSLYGLCSGLLSMTVRSIKNGDSKIEINNAFNSAGKTSSVEVFSSPIGKGEKCDVGLELLDLESTINIFDVCLVDVSNQRVKIASLVLLPVTQELYPVTFIIGSPRSGTSAVGNLVQRSFDVKSHGEAHVANAFQELIEHSKKLFDSSLAVSSKGILINEVPALYIEAQLVLNFRQLYQRFYSNQPIVDKTPGIKMIECLPLLFKVFPHAKVICCQRRGIENISSRMRKFPKVPFEGHCKQWKRSILLWQKMKQTLNESLGHSQWCMQIEQFNLASNPQTVISELLTFLDMPSSKDKMLNRYLERHTPQKTSKGPEHVLSFQNIDWTEEQKESFLSHCGAFMHSIGYSLDESYYLG
jgi:hypothetical protein